MVTTILVFSPLVAFATIAFLGRWLGRQGSCVISVGFSMLTFTLAIVMLAKIALNSCVYVICLATWFDVGGVHISWEILYDALTATMVVVISSISLLVHLYSTEYMANDPHLPRFMSYLAFFSFFMIELVTANNFVQLFFGWEGVGLASYLLISFWSTRIQANKSAIKAIVLNRIGDFGLSLAIFLTFYLFNSLEFGVVFASAYEIQNKIFNIFGYNFFILDLLVLLLFVGAVGKSAQLGLHTWLPDAMEGPTPVSALIHAATMVTAGVFLLIRCSPLLEYSSGSLGIVTCVGGITCFFAATVGTVQNDLKRVIAYSTCSQLGYMVFVCGLSSYSSGIFHLTNHAFFKALLFLGAGAVIHALADEQDMRRMGGLSKILPFTYVSMLVGSLSLIGFPFLTGFYSKEHILEIAYASYTLQANFVYWLGAISALLTAFYSTRLLYITFLAEPRGSKVSLENSHEPNFAMYFTFIVLILGSVFVGYFLRDGFVGFGTDFWGNSIFGLSSGEIDSEYIPTVIKLIPLFFTLLGTIFSFFLYSLWQKYMFDLIYYLYRTRVLPLYIFFSKRWFFDVIYNKFALSGLLNFGYNTSFKLLDRGFVDYLGPSLIYSFINGLSNFNSKIQSGFIYHHLASIIVGLNLLLMLQFLQNKIVVDVIVVSILFSLLYTVIEQE